MKTVKKPTICEGCNVEFPSRSAVFKHLRDTNGACLSPEAFDDFVRYLEQTQREKCLILYGYRIDETSHVHSGEDAVQILLETFGMPDAKYTRSFGHMSRASDIVKQDEGTGAVTELLAINLPPILSSVENWIEKVNKKLPNQIRVFGRRLAPIKQFNAESFASHRKCEYILPIELLYHSSNAGANMKQFLDTCTDFGDGEDNTKPPTATIKYLFRIKKIMQSMQSQIVELDKSNQVDTQEKKWSEKKRQKEMKNSKGENANGKRAKKKELLQENESSKKCLLKRRRFHNFTPKAMAHETLVYRRLDRCYHRATIGQKESDRPFMVVSLTGDMFLQGQVERIIGLVVALARGVVDPEFVECVFDENYPHLVPTPPAPRFAMYMTETVYDIWEGKAKAVLTPRKCSSFAEGWNDVETLRNVDAWKAQIRRGICRQWSSWGDEHGVLVSVQQWIESVLTPWAKKARTQLAAYRQWKENVPNENAVRASSIESIPSLTSLDRTVPFLYQQVLDLLREVDRSGRWPATSTKRQLVMVSTALEGDDNVAASSSLASNLATIETAKRSSSAYVFQEGDGGASGSFTVGAFPGGQPKSNEEFKDLMKAAFDLEVALRPDRKSSSTIAINRNAQFRPHTDSGAGAGQSTSLIVGMGDYIGGELVVESETKDIRYKPVEFNGWKERHWTMPFRGERYSLVWFTPRGCEQIRGVDLCNDSA